MVFLDYKCIFKEVETKKKNFRQSLTKHLQNFSSFSSTSLQYKWNGTKFYHWKMNVGITSRIVVWLKAEDLRKLGNYKKVPERFAFDGKYSDNHKKTFFFPFFIKSRTNSAVKHTVEKYILLKFSKLCTTFCPILSEETNFHFWLSADFLHFSVKTLFQMEQVIIHENILLLSTKKWSFMEFKCTSKELKIKRKIRTIDEVRKLQKKPWNVWIWWQVLRRPQGNQILTFFVKSSKTSAVKHSTEKSILPKFSKLCTTFCPMLSEETNFHF